MAGSPRAFAGDVPDGKPAGGPAAVARRPVDVVYSGDNPPVVSTVSPELTPVVATGDAPVTFSAECWEPQGGALVYSWKVDGRAVPGADSWLKYGPPAGDSGTHTVSMTVSSAQGDSAQASWQVLTGAAPAAAAETSPPVVQGFVEAVAVDAAGNRYVAGYFTGTLVDFDTGPGVRLITSTGAEDVFVTRYNADGTYGWTQYFGGSDTDKAYGITVSGGTVYVVGEFKSDDAVVGGAGTAVSNAGVYDCFVLALDASTGAAVTGFSGDGVQTFGGTATDTGYGVVESGGTLYVAGSFASSDAKIAGAGTAVASAGSYDAFVMALDASTGAAVTAFSGEGVQTFGGTDAEEAYGVAVSGTTVYAAGGFTSTNAGVGGLGSVSRAGGIDAFVLALKTGDGSAETSFSGDGVQTFGGFGDDIAYGVAVAGSVAYVVGTFDSSSAKIGGTGTAVGSAGGWDCFALALDSTSGAAVTSFSGEGVQTFGGSGEDYGYGLVVSGTTTVYVAGSFASTNAKVGAAGTAVASVGLTDAFVLALKTSNGAVEPSFTSDGVRTFGGTASELGYGVAVYGSVVFLAGRSYSTNAQVDGTGTYYSFTGWNGFLLGLIPDGQATVHPPIIQGHAQAVATDSAGNRYVVGYFSGTVDFNPGAGVDQHTAVGNTDAFITRYNSAGTYAWTQTFGGADEDYAYGVATNGTTVFVTGRFKSTNAGIGFAGHIAPAGGFDCFVLALSASTGAAVTTFSADGVQTFGGAGDDEGAAIALSSVTVFVAGSFASSDAKVGGAGAGIASAGGSDVFVMALSLSTGAAVTGFSTDGLQTFGGSTDDFGYGVAVSSSAVYAVGSFTSSDAQVGAVGATLAPAGSSDAFVLSLSSSNGGARTGFGTAGVQTFGGSTADSAYGVTLAGSGVYAVGSFSSGDAGVGSIGSIASIGPSDGFVLALDAGTGAALGGFSIDGVETFGGAGDDAATAATSSSGVVYAAGTFDSNNAGVGGTGSIAAIGLDDAFVLGLDQSTGAQVAFDSLAVHTFGGAGDDRAYGAAVTSSRVVVVGDSDSTDAQLDGAGAASDATGWDGFMISPKKYLTSSGGGGGGGGGCSLLAGPAGAGDSLGGSLIYLLLAGMWVVRRLSGSRRRG